MTKTHAEFLEELQGWLIKEIENDRVGFVRKEAYTVILGKIAEFQAEQKIVMDCEWNPEKNRAAYPEECHAVATWSLGPVTGASNWRVCDDCEKLPEFRKFKRRINLKKQNKSR
jgi:hypothetical protein